MTDTTLPTPVDASRPDRCGGCAGRVRRLRVREADRAVGRQPRPAGLERRGRRDRGRPACGRRGGRRSGRARPVPSPRPPDAPDAARRRPCGLDQRRTSTRFKAMLDPVVDKLQRDEEVAHERHGRRDRRQGDRRRDGRPARLPLEQGAGAVRPRARRHAAAAAGRPEHRRRPSASCRSTRPTSASGWPCTRRRTGCSSPRCRGCATTWSPATQAARRATSRPRREDLARRFEQLTKNLPEVLSSGEGHRPSSSRPPSSRRRSPS